MAVRPHLPARPVIRWSRAMSADAGVGVVHVNLLGREPVSGRFESPRRRLRVKARVSDPESGVGLDARLRGLGCGGNRRERSAARQALAGGGVFHLASWRKVGDVARRSKLE